MRTVEWPQQDDFLRLLDRLKDAHGYRYDSALAEAAGISHTALSNWRSGKARPSITALTRIAEAIDESPHTLITAAGLIAAEDDTPDRPVLPREIQRLADLYWAAPEGRRGDILARVQFVVEWAEATQAMPATADSPPRRRRAG